MRKCISCNLLFFLLKKKHPKRIYCKLYKIIIHVVLHQNSTYCIPTTKFYSLPSHSKILPSALLWQNPTLCIPMVESYPLPSCAKFCALSQQNPTLCNAVAESHLMNSHTKSYKVHFFSKPLVNAFYI